MKLYCTYLTIYSGNKLPSFYIGSTSIENIKLGYHGSVHSKMYKTIWKNELKENPHLFKTNIISIHDTRKDAIIKEEKFHRMLNVVKSSMYINMAIATPNGFHGRNVSGENNPMYGKKHSEYSKSFMNASKKGKPLSKEHAEKVINYQKTFWNTDSSERDKRRAQLKLLNSGENNGMFGKCGKNNPNYGRKASESECIAKSKALKGKIRREDQVKKQSKVYTVKQEYTNFIFTGYGLTQFCKTIGADINLMKYHFNNNTNKYINGYKIIEILDKPSDNTPKLADIINKKY